MTELVLEAWSVVLALAPWLLLGAAIAGLMHGLLPPGFIRRKLRGRFAVTRAVALGVPLPLCSCGVIPAALGLKRDGATDGAAVGFLIATPQTGIDSLMVSASFLGWPFAFWKVASAALTGLVGGWLTDRISPSAEPIDSGQAGDGPKVGAVAHAIDMIRTIWRWIVFGIVASALITVYLPKEWMTSLTGVGMGVSVAIVLSISVPLYVCATASVPIAAALVAGGMPAGLALVFLMAGPATNVATIGAVRKAFGGRVLAVYLATIIAGSVFFGLAFDFVLDSGTAPAHAHDHAARAGPLAIGSALALLAMFTWFAWEDVMGFFRRETSASPEAATIELTVTGMTCGNCVRHVENALRATEGVETVAVVLEGGAVTVAGTASLEALQAAVRKAGYESARRLP